MADLLGQLSKAESTIAKLTAKLESSDAMIDLKVEMRALEVERNMKKEIEAAFVRGMAHCKQTMIDLKELQG